MKPRGELIYTQCVCGIDVPVYRVAPKSKLLLTEDGTHAQGIFDDEACAIYIRRGLSLTAERDAINHELLHAQLLLSGARSFLISLVREPDKWHDSEETLVRILTPHMMIGWAK